jgi:hypothetical protein
MNASKMTRMVRVASTAALAAAMLSACQTTASRTEAVVLKADEVRRLFVGNTVESHNLNTSFTSFTYYHPNGQAVQERLWARRLGTWSIQDDGRICLAFGKREAKCRHIVSRDGRYFKVRPDEQGNPQEIVRYRYFSEGNALLEQG